MWRWIQTFSLICLIFAASFLLTRAYDKTDCIKSNLVHRLDIDGVSLYSCASRSLFSYNWMGYSPFVKKAKASVEDLDSLSSLFVHDGVKPILLSIDSENVLAFQVRSHRVRMGARLAQNTKYLKTAIVEALLKQMEPPTAKDYLRELTAQILVNQFTISVRPSPVALAGPTELNCLVNELPPSLPNLCEFVGAANFSESEKEALSSLLVENQPQTFIPFIAENISSVSKAYSAEAQFGFARELLKKYQSLTWHKSHYELIRSELPNLKWTEWIQHEVSYVLGEPARFEVLQTFGGPEVLLQRSFRGVESTQKTQARVVFVCGPSHAEHLAKMGDKHLVVAAACANDLARLDWTALSYGNTAKFLSDNPELPYVEIHLSSLRVALANSWVLPGDDLLDLATYRLRRSKLGVEKESFSESLHRYKIDAAINVYLSRRST